MTIAIIQLSAKIVSSGNKIKSKQSDDVRGDNDIYIYTLTHSLTLAETISNLVKMAHSTLLTLFISVPFFIRFDIISAKPLSTYSQSTESTVQIVNIIKTSIESLNATPTP